ncbi:MAG: hypothetical protein AB7P49_00680 [Bdellovibrionales bacterium]
MATNEEIDKQLAALGCTHKLPYHTAAAFILLHANPQLFESVERMTGSSIADLRKIDYKVLLNSVDPELWTEMGKVFCARYNHEVARKPPSLLDAFLKILCSPVPTWVSVCLCLALAVPKCPDSPISDVEARFIEAIKKKASEDGLPPINDQTRKAAYEAYKNPTKEQIIDVYVYLFNISK